MFNSCFVVKASLSVDSTGPLSCDKYNHSPVTVKLITDAAAFLCVTLFQTQSASDSVFIRNLHHCSQCNTNPPVDLRLTFIHKYKPDIMNFPSHTNVIIHSFPVFISLIYFQATGSLTGL